MQEIESASALQMYDSSAATLLDEIQRRQKLPRFSPWVGGGTAVACLVAAIAELGAVAVTVILVLGSVLYWWTRMKDAMRRTVVIAYGLETDIAGFYEDLIASVKNLHTAGGLWHVQAKADVYNRKYHAGASSLIKRSATSPRMVAPPVIKTNIEVPSLNAGKQQLFFFPDRLLVFEGTRVGAISYRSLQVEVGVTQFIEEDSVPNDAQIVGRTWRYVNKKGGPDKRFKNNRELPIACYETIHLSSSTGLNELLHVSRIGLGENISNACVNMSRAVQSLN